MILTQVKAGRGVGPGSGEAETKSWGVVWGSGVSWGQVMPGCEERGHGVWTDVGRRQKSRL